MFLGLESVNLLNLNSSTDIAVFYLTHCVKYARIRVFVARVFPYNAQENTGQRKPVFSHILRTDSQKETKQLTFGLIPQNWL